MNDSPVHSGLHLRIMAHTMPMPAKRLVQPYRVFLTPNMHRRFTNAAVLTTVVCYAEAVWMGSQNYLWRWFPVGPAGLRTLMLVLSALVIYILRISEWHIGARTVQSGFGALKQNITSSRIAIVLLWYILSAMIFCETYIWSASAAAKLYLVESGKFHERPKLNERPIFLRTMFFCVAILQSVIHLYKSYDQSITPHDLAPTSLLEEKPGIQSAIQELSQSILQLAHVAAFRLGLVTLFGPIFYVIFLHRAAWHWNFYFASFYVNMSKNTRPGLLPPSLGEMSGRLFVEGFLLVFLWEFVNRAFTIMLSQPPLKRGVPLTNDSKDPNATLLAGLRAKKEIPRNMAFWELAIISEHFPSRRKTIYTEIDRAGGSTWSQVLTICLGELHAIVKRIQDTQPQRPAPMAPTDSKALNDLPKILAPLKQENIFTATPRPTTRYEQVGNDFGNLAKQYGQSSGGANPLSPQIKKLITFSKDAVLSAEQQKELTPSGLQAIMQSYLTRLLKSPVGPPFRQLMSRRIVVIVLGTPFSSKLPIRSAIQAITKLAVCSLEEDNYGRVHQDISIIIRTFTSTIKAVENFTKSHPIHWTDVDYKDADRNVAEVESILQDLRSCLSQLIGHFEGYADNMGLKMSEIRLAKEAAGGG